MGAFSSCMATACPDQQISTLITKKLADCRALATAAPVVPTSNQMKFFDACGIARTGEVYICETASYECIVGSTTECSASCGVAGVRTTARSCRSTLGASRTVVDSHFCAGDCRTSSTPCPALPACPDYSYEGTEWSPCSATCGLGTRITNML